MRLLSELFWLEVITQDGGKTRLILINLFKSCRTCDGCKDNYICPVMEKAVKAITDSMRHTTIANSPFNSINQ